MANKDFSPIENDYAFFMAHASEAENDAALYAFELAHFAAGREIIRWLDFGCGTGEFTERLATLLNWPPASLRLTLVEPVQPQREEAARRLARFSQHPIESGDRLPSIDQARFDLVLSNHALYYVENLGATLRQMIRAVDARGKLLLAIAGWDNALMELWQFGFGAIGQPVPYYAAEDVELELAQLGLRFRGSRSPYQLRFADTEGNRLAILRFLFGDHLQEMPRERLLGEFERWVQGNEVIVDTHSYHYAVERK